MSQVAPLGGHFLTSIPNIKWLMRCYDICALSVVPIRFNCVKVGQATAWTKVLVHLWPVPSVPAPVCYIL